MSMTTAKTLGAVVGVVALAGTTAGGALAPLAAEAVTAPDAGAVAAVECESESALTGVASVREVQGAFAFTQDAITSNEALSGVFQKAAAQLCVAIPDYAATTVARAILVQGPSADAFEATLSELDGEDATESRVMACACATNLPGGGAMANAEVSGVTLEALASLASA